MNEYIKDEIRALLNDLESDRIERTISTTNTDKFGQAICAFANDLPNHQMPGFLFLGVLDNGEIQGVDATDALLKNVAAIRTDGNIQPQPTMTVEKIEMDEGDNEHILMEKRRANVKAFDASPCLNATIDDLDLRLFKHYFLPKAMSDEELEAENKANSDVRYQLSAFGFFDILHNCPTNAAMLFFAKNLRRFIPGAYVQYVRFAGKDRSGDIMTEHEFKGKLCTALPELDTFIKTTIANRRPIPVSALREESVVDYPDWATRELLMNAICHRDYTSHGPIQFYQYDDRIEIMNHGGLYGRANEENFPNVNDYRNIVVAEAMKVLGFVNRHSRGVLRVQKELIANENGEAVYDFGYQTAVLVREKKSPLGERMTAAAIANGFLLENGEIRSNSTILDEKQPKKQPKKWSEMKIPVFPSKIVEDVFKALKLNPKAKYSWLADNLGVSERTVQRSIDDLKKIGYINPEHSKIKGVWQLLK